MVGELDSKAVSVSSTAHRVCVLLYWGVSSFDVAGPTQALLAAGPGLYEIMLASVDGGLVQCDCPGVMMATASTSSIIDPIDTLIIPGGASGPSATSDRVLVEWVQRLAARAPRVVCVCTGAFLAAQAGLLTGRRVATHWWHCDDLARRFQNVRVDRDAIWIRDGGIWTSAGHSAGIDLSLALIEDDHGIDLALKVARHLVVFFKRPGGQSQFSNVLAAQIADAGGPIERLLAWLADNLGADLKPQTLADKAGMSLRNFARNCTSHTGMTPAKLIETLRVKAAREAIEKSETSFESLAIRYGFGDEQRMRRAFSRQIGATPAELRSRFGEHR